MAVNTTPILILALLLTGALSTRCSGEEMKPYTEPIAGTVVKFDMVPIPGGTFILGSPAGEKGRGDDEGPQREVEIKPFWMGKFEVTWDEFDIYAFSHDIKVKEEKGLDLKKQSDTEMKADAVTRPTPPYADMTFGLGHDKQPAICMTHHAAMEYCRWISEKTGKAYRLATEAEWEYACRAGAKTVYSFGDDPALLKDYAWFTGNSDGKPQPIGSKKPNAFGLHDMHGNVSEWVFDYYTKEFYGTLKEKSAQPVNAIVDRKYPHTARGGSWDDEAPALRSATRRASEKDWSRQDPQLPQSIWWHTDAKFVGFRIVRPLDEQENLKGVKSKVTKEGD